MKYLAILFALLFASCPGGAAISFYVHSDGNVTASTDTNTVVVVNETGGAIMLRTKTEVPIPVWLAEFNESGVHVWIFDLDGEMFEGHYQLGEPLPVAIEENVRGVLTAAELEALMITFQ